MAQIDREAIDNLHSNKMTNNSAIAVLSSTSVLDSRFEFSTRSKSWKVNDTWFYCAIFGLAGGAVAMLFGLVASLIVWMNGQFLNESKMGVFSTLLLVASFALFFIGGYCLDKAYDSFYRCGEADGDKKGGANGVS